MSDWPIPPAIAKIAPDGNLTSRQLRRFMIDMIMRRVKPGTGSGHDFMQRRTAMNPWPDLRPLLKGIPWVIVGGVATRAYMPERMTKDLDILVSEKDGKETIRRLEQAGYRIVSRLAVGGYLMLAPDGVEIDVLFGKYPWLAEALSRPQQDEAGYPVIGLPYLVMMKMSAQRTRDMGDLGTLLGWATDEALEEVRAAVKKYAPEDLEDLEALIFIGKKEREMPTWEEDAK